MLALVVRNADHMIIPSPDLHVNVFLFKTSKVLMLLLNQFSWLRANSLALERQIKAWRKTSSSKES